MVTTKNLRIDEDSMDFSDPEDFYDEIADDGKFSSILRLDFKGSILLFLFFCRTLARAHGTGAKTGQVD
jgi:hypothetical protein